MAQFLKVAWVRPAEPIGGLDHLGVQAPCVALYTELLPGITNVTDRARYYTFHPWLIWSFEKRYEDHSLEQFRRVLRRAECLFALIAIRHARQLADGDDGRHGKAMTGRDKLLRISEADDFSLDEYAALDGPNRYFKNKDGSLGQYYFGPLRDLRVLDRSPQGLGYPPGYDRERGRALAEAFDSAVPADTFFRVMEKPSSTWADLDQLAAFCPCALPRNAVEYELLLDLFLARSETFRIDDGLARRASLGLMLDLASRKTGDPKYAFDDMLRGAAYSGALLDGSLWQVAPVFQRSQRGWGTYQRNELLSLALQGLFSAVLRATERDLTGRLLRVADAADVAANLLLSMGTKLTLPLSELVAQVRAELPALTNWLDANHEIQRGWRLQGLRLDDDRLEEVAAESVAILLALLARGVDEYPYADFELDPEYFDPREVHLLSLRQVSRSEWAIMSVQEWIRWLAVHWGINRHLRVALRKLRGERRDTFRIRPLEGELRVVEAPKPGYTIPRIGRSVQILRDLNLIDYNDEGAVVLTPRGQQELEACRGS
jgi:hypothetical protein